MGEQNKENCQVRVILAHRRVQNGTVGNYTVCAVIITTGMEGLFRGGLFIGLNLDLWQVLLMLYPHKNM